MQMRIYRASHSGSKLRKKRQLEDWNTKTETVRERKMKCGFLHKTDS